MCARNTGALWRVDLQISWKSWKKLQEFPLDRLLSIQAHTNTHHLQQLENNHLELNLEPFFFFFAERRVSQPQRPRGRKSSSEIKRVVAEVEGKKRRRQQQCVHPPTPQRSLATTLKRDFLLIYCLNSTNLFSSLSFQRTSFNLIHSGRVNAHKQRMQQKINDAPSEYSRGTFGWP